MPHLRKVIWSVSQNVPKKKFTVIAQVLPHANLFAHFRLTQVCHCEITPCEADSRITHMSLHLSTMSFSKDVWGRGHAPTYWKLMHELLTPVRLFF